MNWLTRIIKPAIKATTKRASTPEGVWIKCTGCGQMLFQKEVARNFDVCPRCSHHLRITALRRMELTLDKDGQQELFTNLMPGDPLKFKDLKRYRDRVREAQKATERNDSVTVFKGTIKGIPAVVTAFDFDFLAGSMASVAGAKIAQGALAAAESKCGYIVFATSGGARMQEGILSLMQMAKTSAALTKLDRARMPFLSVLTDPTTGGVTASFAMLGDVIIAEPNALICFAGPRVIEQTIREKLPDGFQRSEYLLEHGSIDMIVPRAEMRDVLAELLHRFTGVRPVEEVTMPPAHVPAEITPPSPPTL